MDRPPAPSERARAGRREWLAALVLGILGGVLQSFDAPILTEESPLFTWWQAPVLFGFVVLGPRLGLVVAAIALAFDVPALAELWAIHPGVALGALIYVLEAFVVWWLYRRMRSLPMGSALFWISIGWLLDVALYIGWVGLAPDYVTMLLLKQVLNGLLYASLVDLIALEPVRRFALGRAEPDAYGVEQYAFRGFVVLAMLPLALVGVLYARAQYAEALESEELRNSEIAFDFATDLRQTLEEQGGEARELLRRLERPSTAEERRNLLTDHLSRHSSLTAISVVDDEGVIVEAEPPMSAGGFELLGQSLADRAYFERVQSNRQTTYSGHIRSRFVSPAEQRPFAALAEPRLDESGDFEGAVVWAIDIKALLNELSAGQRSGRDITLIDGEGVILASTNEQRIDGSLAKESVLDGGGAGTAERRTPLGDSLEHREVFSYYPERNESVSSQLGLDLVHAVHQPVRPPGWSVLVDLPAEALHARFRRTAIQIVAIFVLLVLAVYLMVKRFARRITDPVRSAAAVAAQVREGTLLDDAPLEHMRSSHLLEMRQLGTALTELDRSLQRQRRETAEREEDLQHKLTEAQKMEAVGLLAGGVAHDFNNLLTPILGYADLGLLTSTAEEERQYFQSIQNSAKEAAKVTSQLLAFGRRQVLDMESVDLVEEIRECPTLLRPLLREDIKLDVEIHVEQAPALVDTAQFHRILFNLALNAQDAMPQGGRLCVRLDHVDVAPGLEEASQPAGYSKISIDDDGCGMSSEVQRQMFEPFFSTKGPERGSGLGLATVYGIVRQHDGSVEVDSVEGKGTSFRVFLPVVDRERTGQETLGSRAPKAFDRQISVFLVEDDDPARDVVTAYLSRAGFRVEAFANAETLLDRLGEDPARPDALITDVVLPGMNGKELYERVQEVRPGLPTLLISGYGHEVLASAGLPNRVRLLNKPFTQRELVDSVQAVLKSERRVGSS